MIREAIEKLVEHRPFSGEEAREVLGQIMAGDATEAQIGAFITALRMRGETPDIIAGCARAMREHAIPIPPPPGPVVDTCGTGGDNAGTFNISTASALVAAGVGLCVAKHGNRSVSSRCGSADVVDALGVRLDLSPEQTAACLREVGMAFLFAPVWHPAMKHAIGPRREIGIRTVFNILGPLSNPAGAQRGVLGVYSDDLVPVMANASAELGAEHLFVVHGSDGLDEITLTGPTRIAEVRDGSVHIFTWSPEEIGLSLCSASDLLGGDAQENARLLRALLDGATGPHRDIVLINAAAALVAGGRASDLAEGYREAAAAVDNGAAREKLDALIHFTRDVLTA